MATIAQALTQLKSHLTDAVPPDLIRRLLRDLDYSWRDRTLNPVVTTYLFLRQVLHGNTPVGTLRHLSGLDFTDSAYCQARARLPLAFFRDLQRAACGRLRADTDDDPDARWRGHRLFLLDGSSFSMPDSEELRETFGQPGAQAVGCGFPVAHLTVLCNARTGDVLKAVANPLRTHDLSKASVAHTALQPDDVLVGDRAYCSYAHLALCRGRRLHGLFRAHQRLLVDFRPGRRWAAPGTPAAQATGLPRSRWLRRLGPRDQLVEYHKPQDRPDWLSAADYAALPDTLVVRELRVRVTCRGGRTQAVTLVTTLTDARRYPARAVAALYGLRWRVEVNLRHLKQTLGMDVLRCATLTGVLKELAVFVVVYNLVRRLMREAARRQGVAPDRISFVDALRWLRHARPGQELPKLRVVPLRPGRVEPRVRKRRPKQFPLLRKPRAVLRKALEKPKKVA